VVSEELLAESPDDFRYVSHPNCGRWPEAAESPLLGETRFHFDDNRPECIQVHYVLMNEKTATAGHSAPWFNHQIRSIVDMESQ